MRVISRSLVYVFTFLLLLCLAVLFAGDFWRPLDYKVFRALQSADTLELEDKLYLIDIPHTAEGVASFDRADFRRRLAEALRQIDGMVQDYEKPAAVVFDIVFTSDDDELDVLVAAMAALEEKKIDLFFVRDTEDRDTSNYDAMVTNLATRVYDSFSNYRLHTEFIELNDVLSYESEFAVRRSLATQPPKSFTALALKVASEHGKAKIPEVQRRFILPLGPAEEVTSRLYRFEAGGGFVPVDSTVGAIDATGAILLIANLKGDQTQDMHGQSGPYHIMWALNDQLQLNTGRKAPLDHAGMTIGLMLFSGLMVALLFGFLYKLVTPLQTRPIVTGVVAAGLAMLMLVALSAGFLALNSVIPIGLPLVSILIAAPLAVFYARRFLVTGSAEGTQEWDVFISYSRKDGDYVQKHLYEPLSRLEKPDGSPLRVFYDIKTISFGEPFTARYMRAIVNSRYFMPVFSEHYNKPRSHGRNEIELAFKRKVEGNIRFLPVTFADEHVEKIYSGINYINVTLGVEPIDEYGPIITGKVSQDAARGD